MFRRTPRYGAGVASSMSGGAFKPTKPCLVAYEVQKYTKDGKQRARMYFQGPREFEQRWWRKLHMSKICFGGTIFWFAIYPYLDFRKEIPENEKFLKLISLQPHGVMGDQFALTWSNKRVAPYPDSETVVVDPTTLETLQANAEGNVGTSGAIYNWLNLKGPFPDTVKERLYGMCDAKSQTYQDGPGSQRKTVVHVISPDFRIGQFTEREAVLLLAKAYRNCFAEFVRSGKKTLRIPPLGSAQFSGDLTDQLYQITQESMMSGFEQLHPFDRRELLKKNIELCIFLERDWDKYANRWQYHAPASQSNAGIPQEIQDRARKVKEARELEAAAAAEAAATAAQ